MTDIKTYSFGNSERDVPAGDPLHDMWLRLTLTQSLTIESVDVAMDATPHNMCPAITPNFQRLVGLSVAKGFLKAASQQLGGTEGCTHLRELLQQVGTVAYQTMFSVRGHKRTTEPRRVAPMLLNTCHTYAETSPYVTQRAAG
jgi:hypothetical protein